MRIVVAVLLWMQTPDPNAILTRASKAYEPVSTFSADFVQVIANPMVGAPDTTRGRLYERRPSEFAMRFTAPPSDRIVADGHYLWLYTPSTTPNQVIRRRIPETGTTGPHLIGQFVEHPERRFVARYVRADSSSAGVADVLELTPRDRDSAPYGSAKVWISREDGLVRRLDITESGGQERTVVLSRLVINGKVSSGEFRFTPPAGTRVVDQ